MQLNEIVVSLFTVWILLVPSQFLCAERPNFIVILADDLGYGDTQPFNAQSKIETPNFTRLAKQGMIFTDAHSGSAVCTPTRYGLLCGRYAWRTKLKRGVLGGYSKPLIAETQQTFASLLQKAGYHTHVVGKWHLGLGWQWMDKSPNNVDSFGKAEAHGAVDFSKPLRDGPLEHGFNSCYLFPASLDMSPYVFINDRTVETQPNRIMEGGTFPGFYRKGESYEGFRVEDALGILTKKAQAYIAEQSKSNNPFCFYFPLTAPHKPVSPSENFQGKTNLGPYGDFVSEVDWTIGQIMKTLDDTGMANNTVLIVTSDNGSFMKTTNEELVDHVGDKTVQAFQANHHRANGKFLGTKADIYEAGHRVPFYVRWPEKMPKRLRGTANASTICHTDILGTVCSISGLGFDAKQSPDSFDFSNIIVGKALSNDRPGVVNHSINGTFAIRNGNWKLILGNGSGGRRKPKGKPFSKPYQLFDLGSDPEESSNEIEGNIELAAKMEAAFLEIANGDHEQIDMSK